ncbi:DUF262 and DUF1524 domain-containing protein [soil metagenome]
MPNLTNVEARGVNTVEWLSASDTTIAVPVYQRHYRWDANACRRLLDDILAVADRDDGQTHFIGSILATATTASGVTELTLIDGQQRVTTLMLLIAALQHGAKPFSEAAANQFEMMLRHPVASDQTKLRPHKLGAGDFTALVLGRVEPQDAMDIVPVLAPEAEGLSAFDANYRLFLRETQGDDVRARVWKGLNRLEHVAIILKENANPQQIFESLNSTGAPLANHELIHNYVLMGLSYEEQTVIEDSFWVPIEEKTGDAHDSFWRDYLIMKTGRDTEFSGEYGVYDVFRKEFPQLKFENLTNRAEEWREYSDIYRVLLDPAHADDPEIKTQLGYINILSTAMYPVLLAVYRDYQHDVTDKSMLIEVLERLQSLLIRRMVVGQSRDHLAAQLCRRRLKGATDPIPDILRRTPEDERVRHALKYRNVPHAGYVLGRIERLRFPEDCAIEFPAGLEIEHIFPQGPTDQWTGGVGHRAWGAFSEEERAKYREMRHTLGNIALLEQPLNAGASNKSFEDKKRPYYEKSHVRSTKALVDVSVWDVSAIEKRTAEMTEEFLAIWRRPPVPGTVDTGEPILDAPKKGGYYPGWKTEFEYVRFCDEIWEVHNFRELRARLYQHLWDTRREKLVAWDVLHHPDYFHIRETKDPHFIFDPLGESHYLYNGWLPQFNLGEIQELLDEFNLADEMFLKYTADQE